jgi:FkbM family methyltransferase
MEADQLDFVEITFSVYGTRRMFFRKSSQADKEIVKQIFDQKTYNISSFPLSGSLKSYGDSVSANGASLLIVDAGANIGASAVYFSQLDPRIHVCAIEPERGNFSVLKANCTGLPITPIEAAIASKPGQLWLTDPGMGELGFRVGGSAGTLQVEAITMNDTLKRFDASRYMPLICKIDIEGSEDDLFSTNDGWVDQFPLIIIELHDWMLPGTSNSKNFLSAISKRHFDIIYRGELMFCFNNLLLSKSPRLKD